jgi:hypothetical protein
MSLYMPDELSLPDEMEYLLQLILTLNGSAKLDSRRHTVSSADSLSVPLITILSCFQELLRSMFGCIATL